MPADLQSAADTRTPRTISVLVAEDEEINRVVLTAILDNDRYQTHIAEDGAQAVSLFERESIDLVLMDIMMPVMDGYEATRRIKQLAGDDHVPVIFLTALTDEYDLAKCIASGGDDFLTKPYSRVLLNAKIKAQLRIRELYNTTKKQTDALRAHQMQQERDQEVANRIFTRIVHLGCLEDLHIPYHTSPTALFNGDILLASRTPNGALRVMLGDFTGHGLPAAVGAIPTAELFYDMTEKGYHLAEVVTGINTKLNNILPTGFFCAAAMVELNFKTRLLDLWMGGLPEIYVYGGSPHRIKRCLVSNHLPLGIVDSERLDPLVESHGMDPDDRLLLYSDGLIEAKNTRDEDYGADRLKGIIESGTGLDWTMPLLLKDIRDFRSGVHQADDTSLIEIPCDLHEVPDPMEDQSRPTAERTATHWHTVLLLRADALREADPIPVLLQTLIEIQGLTQHRSNLYTILAELYANALEHGVLGLASALKESPDGFLRYYEERSKRLAELDKGEVRIEFTHQPKDGGGELTIRVTDSGPGFDFPTRPDRDEPNIVHFGRGITLLRKLCVSLEYQGSGNIVEAVYRWQ